MTQQIKQEVIRGMLPYLNNAQLEKLQSILDSVLKKHDNQIETENAEKEQDYVDIFLAAKRVEGCSEKSLKYYDATIRALLGEIKKGVCHIETEDIRNYLTEYQAKKLEKIRLILSIVTLLECFFA